MKTKKLNSEFSDVIQKEPIQDGFEEIRKNDDDSNITTSSKLDVSISYFGIPCTSSPILSEKQKEWREKIQFGYKMYRHYQQVKEDINYIKTLKARNCKIKKMLNDTKKNDVEIEVSDEQCDGNEDYLIDQVFTSEIQCYTPQNKEEFEISQPDEVSVFTKIIYRKTMYFQLF